MPKFEFDPAQLVRAVEARLPQGRGVPAVAAEILDLLFRASIHPEEGEVPRCAVAVMHPRLPCVADFSDVRLDATWIRKVSAAFDPAHLLVAVDPDDASVARGVVERQFVEFIASDVAGAGPTCWAEILGVARLALHVGDVSASSAGDRVHATTWRDRVGFEVPEQLVAEAAAEVERAGVRATASWNSRRSQRVLWRIRSDRLADAARLGLQCAIVDLAARIRRHGRGGCVLLVPDSSSDALDSIARRRERFRPRTPVLSVFPWAWGFAHGQLLRVLATDQEAPPSLELLEDVREDLLTAGRANSELMRRTADLTRVDGCVVLDSVLHPRAVAAKFESFQGSSVPPSVTAWLDERHAGMRHRSLASAVFSVAGALGLVVSQDGDATVFDNGVRPHPSPFEMDA